VDTKTFIGKVLPEEDAYVLFIVKGGSRYNTTYTDINELCAAISAIDKTVATVYFAVGKFRDHVQTDSETGKTKITRTQACAARFKSLCVDIDIGPDHVYKTQGAAAKALLTACDVLGLTAPMLVNSGYGVHAYWPLAESINADVWEMLSTALGQALTSKQVDYDRSKIRDRSMVLRPHGTNNKKDPGAWKPVSVVMDGAVTPVMELATKLAPYKGAPPKQNKARRKSAIMDAILDYEYDPVALADIQGCKQVGALIATGGATDCAGRPVEEPLWRASLGIAKYCDDPTTAIASMCSGHPDFSLEKCLEKMENWQGSGPTTCAKFAELNPEGCTGCVHSGKITTPMQVSKGREVTTAAVVEPDAPTEPAVPYESIAVKGYSMKGGWVIYTPPGSDESVPVVNPAMFVVCAVTNTEKDTQTISLCVDFGASEGWQVVEIPYLAISRGGTDLVHALGLHSIYVAGNIDNVKVYLLKYLSELRRLKKIEFFCTNFGWQPDGGFLGPTGLIGGEAGRKVHYSGAIGNYKDHISADGDLTEWIAGTAAFARPDMDTHATLLLMMMSSIIFEGSGLNSLVVNAYSGDSGSGKTVTCLYGLSVWGDPRYLTRKEDDTVAAKYKFLGIMRNVPVYIDEITSMEPDEMRRFVLALPEGREKDRLNRSATGFKMAAHWRTPVFTSSNTNIYEALNIKVTSEADKLRVLQVQLDRLDVFGKDATLGNFLFKLCTRNYGLLGPLLAQAVYDRGGPVKVYEAAEAKWDAEYGFKFHGKERFYRAMGISMAAMAEILTDAKLVRFDAHKAVRSLFPVIEHIRETVDDEAMGGIDVVQQYLSEHANDMVHLRVRPDGIGKDRLHMHECPHQAAVARTEARLDGNGRFVSGLIIINKKMFRSWCRKNGAELSAVVTHLNKEGVKFSPNVRRTLYKGVEGKGTSGQSYCLELDAGSHPRLIDSFDNLTLELDAATARMSVV